MTTKSSVSLTDEQYAFARALVDSGRYPSVSAVLQQGIDLLRLRLNNEEAEARALQALLEKRRKGRFISADRMAGRVSEMIERKRRDHDLQG